MEVIEKIKGIKLQLDEALISLDVVSLFPSIPIELAIEILHKNWKKIKATTDIPKQLFFEIVDFVLRESTYFTYEGLILKQLDGSAMGANVSPGIASLVLNYILDRARKLLPYKMKLCLKFVDDILAIIPRHLLDPTIHTFNSIHPKIQFTHELEHQGQLPYLDLSLIRQENGQIIHDWFVKESASGRILNFRSNHPRHQIINTASNLIKRVFTLSSAQFHNKNIKKAKIILTNNGFPTNIISQLIQKNLHPTDHTPVEKDTIEGSKVHYASLPFHKNLTHKVARVLGSEIPNLKISMKPINQLRTSIFNNMKHKIPKQHKTNIIYKFPCMGKDNEPCEYSYIGQTKNELHTRLGQHSTSVKRAEKRMNDGVAGEIVAQCNTAVVTHFTHTRHFPNIEATTILNTERNKHKRELLESLYISCNKTYNSRRDIDGVSHSYRSILSSSQHTKHPTKHAPVHTNNLTHPNPINNNNN